MARSYEGAEPAACACDPQSSVVRLCCAMRDLVHALRPSVQQLDEELQASSPLCKPVPSRTEGSPWRSGCGAS